ncbi:MAG: VCBS repeat-containing protein [Rhodothermales bacterium]|nr:VCBS repeat-containing protein [Rhodothermales bacterium]MBO6780822.1 VCBS repeat-containing protein [Rhodothermales bacterium]
MICRGLPALLLVLTACALEQPQFGDATVLEGRDLLSANAEVFDANGDGFNDIALAIGRHWPGPNLLLLGDGRGGFAAADTLPFPEDRTYSISAADMDGDGDVDLVVSNDRPDTNYVLINDGLGRYPTRVTFGDPAWHTRNSTVADLNDDGWPDIVVANRDNSPTGNNWTCMNWGDFEIDCSPIASGPATTVTVADVNQDGRPDLVVPYRDEGQSLVLFGATFTRRVGFGPADASFRAAAALDWNRDGRLDLVAIDDRKRTTTVFLQQEDSSFAAGVRVDSGDHMPYALESADIDGDGLLDLLVGYRQAPTRVFFNGDPVLELSLGDSLGTVYGFGVGDVNGDGRADVAVARSGASDVLFLAGGHR